MHYLTGLVFPGSYSHGFNSNRPKFGTQAECRKTGKNEKMSYFLQISPGLPGVWVEKGRGTGRNNILKANGYIVAGLF